MNWRLQKTTHGLAKELKKEADFYARRCQACLTRLGLDHRLAQSRAPGCLGRLLGRRAHQEVTFDLALGDEDAIWLRVDTLSLPYLVSIMKLLNDEVVFNLKYACRRPVEFVDSILSGPWIKIWRDGSIAGIPGLVKISDAMAQVSDTDHPLTVCLGATQGRLMVKLNLANPVHTMVAGASGGGKTVMLNSLLVTLLAKNSPRQLEVWLVDLKRGKEFYPYKDLPHVKHVISEPSQMAIMTSELLDEIERRDRMMAGVAVDLDGWNYQQRRHPENQLPYILYVVDELGELMLHPDRKIRKQAKEDLIRILQIGRSAGVVTLLCTQTPTSEIIPAEVRHNIDARIAFNCGQKSQSILIIGSGDARGLAPRGRCILSWEGKQTTIQAPFIDTKHGQVSRATRQILERWQDPAPVVPLIPIKEIFTYSLENLNGDLPQTKLFEQFRGQVSKDNLLEWLASLDGKVFSLNGQEYRIEKPEGWTPRRIVGIKPNGSEPELIESPTG